MAEYTLSAPNPLAPLAHGALGIRHSELSCFNRTAAAWWTAAAPVQPTVYRQVDYQTRPAPTNHLTMQQSLAQQRA